MESKSSSFNLCSYGITGSRIHYNLSPARLYQLALEQGAKISNQGALMVRSGEKTGRSPSDKRIVRHSASKDQIWWSHTNIPIEEKNFNQLKQRAIDCFSEKNLYVLDGFAGADLKHQVKVRVICTEAYHALFMQNMLIRLSREEEQEFGEPDYVVYNAGKFFVDQPIEGCGKTSVSISFESREMVILGTLYAGEMKKGIFTIFNYIMPQKNILSMHCSANEGASGVTLFFGLSGTGKTTLSSDPKRKLIGDDEHAWSDDGVFNIEGGCYAKCIDLSAEKEPEIFSAIRFGTVLENVVWDEKTHQPSYGDRRITENTRAAYPIDFIANVKSPSVGGSPKNIIFLTCDAFGVLPPVSRLSLEQAGYYFISGYTAKVAGTEVGVNEPQANFSTCFGAPFLVFHPSRYVDLLARKVEQSQARVWMINTGWSGGPYGEGERIQLKYSRAIIDAIHSGYLDQIDTKTNDIFHLAIPVSCVGVPDEILNPRNIWKDKKKYDEKRINLAKLFIENFRKFELDVRPEIRVAGPILPQTTS